jgi:hypothetical protein
MRRGPPCRCGRRLDGVWASIEWAGGRLRCPSCRGQCDDLAPVRALHRTHMPGRNGHQRPRDGDSDMTCCFCFDRNQPTWLTCGCQGARRAYHAGFATAWKEHQDRLAIGTVTATLRPPEAPASAPEKASGPDKAQVDVAVLAFANAILHGDEDHRRWLISAAEAFCAGKRLPKREKRMLTGDEVVELYAPQGICPQCDRRRKRDGYKVKL